MSIVKLNNRSVKDITAFGSISSLGSLTHIATQTASSSASLSFTSGIDSTYKEYIFYFVNIHPATDSSHFTFQADTGTNTNYNQTMTTTHFQAYHNEAGGSTGLDYLASYDQAQGTAFQNLALSVGNSADECVSGALTIFEPSSSVFVKHFIARINSYNGNDFTSDYYTAGYFNTQTALTRVQFKMSSGNIDSGQILLFGLN